MHGCTQIAHALVSLKQTCPSKHFFKATVKANYRNSANHFMHMLNRFRRRRSNRSCQVTAGFLISRSRYQLCEIMDDILEDDYDLSFDENTNAWGNRRTKLLIEKRLALSTEFNEGKRKRSVLWNLVLRNIRLVEPAFPFTVNEVKTKFYNLLTTYKRVKQRNSLSGQGRTNWIYFETFDEFYGNKHSIQPPNENICSTFTCSTELEEDNSEAIKPEKRKRETSKKKDDELLDFLKEQNNIDQQRHQEFMAMEKQRTEIELQKLQALREMQAILKDVTQTCLNF